MHRFAMQNIIAGLVTYWVAKPQRDIHHRVRLALHSYELPADVSGFGMLDLTSIEAIPLTYVGTQPLYPY